MSDGPPRQYGEAVYARQTIPSCRDCAKMLRAGWHPLAKFGTCTGCESPLYPDTPERPGR